MPTSSAIICLLLLASPSLQLPHDDSAASKETKNWRQNAEKSEPADADERTFRLPNDTIPLHYDIWLRTDVDRAIFDFDGRVTIQIHAREPTQLVTLHYRQMTVKSVDLVDASGAILNASLAFAYAEPLSHEFLEIQLPAPVGRDEQFWLSISYNGTLRASNAGFYRAYFDANGTRSFYAVTQFESTDARHAFPCYDEPGIRAPMRLTIQHGRSYSAYANMPLADDSPTDVPGTEYVESRFAVTPPMQTYLLAFLVSPFHHVDAVNSDGGAATPQKILAKPESIARGEADYAASIADAILRKFVAHLGVNFTLPKLDHAAITQFAAGAMENWGLVTYREAALLLASGYSDSQRAFYRRYIAEVIAHEIAHQWTGNLVAPAWWSDLWLNEGFATLYEYYVPHLLWPEDGYEEEFRTSALGQALNNDLPTAASSVPMSIYVESPDAIDRRFNFVSYAKSGAVLRMFQETIGVGTFTKGVRRYLEKMSLKAAVPKDLFDSLQEAVDQDLGAGIDISRVLSTWVYQAGYPLVSVERVGNNLHFSQHRFPSGAEIFSIPLSFVSKSRVNFERRTLGFWLENATLEVPQAALGLDGDDWIVFNVQQTGYYRVSYGVNLWHSIAKGLRENASAFHLVNRRVLQEELNIGYATEKKLLASDVLEVESYLVGESSHLVWTDASSILRALNTTLFGTSAHAKYLDFIRSLTRGHLAVIGLESSPGESQETTQLRARVKAFNCYALDEVCLQHELQKLLAYRADSATAVVPDFCSGFRLADASLYAHFLNELVENASLANRARVVASIGCSLDEGFLEVVVSAVEDTGNVLTAGERTTVMRNMMTTSAVGFEVAFEFLRRNLEQITQFVAQLAATVNTREAAEELEVMIVESLAGGFLSEGNAAILRAAVRSNLEWQAQHLAAVEAWFGEGEVTSTTTEDGNGEDTTTEAGKGEDTTTEADNSEDTTTGVPATTTTPASGSFLGASSVVLMVAGVLARFL